MPPEKDARFDTARAHNPWIIIHAYGINCKSRAMPECCISEFTSIRIANALNTLATFAQANLFVVKGETVN